MNIDETPDEKLYREALEAIVEELQTPPLDLNQDGKETIIYAIATHALGEANRS